MKYYILLFIILLSGILVAQVEPVLKQMRNEISTDLSGAFANTYRVDYIRTGANLDGAFVIGLRTRSESGRVTIDTNMSIRRADRSLSIPTAYQFLDISIGLRRYVGVNHPQRGFWFQVTALASLANRQTDDYQSALTESIFPGEFFQPKPMYGIEGDVGYRYLFQNGLSLSAYISMTVMILRDELISERFTQAQRESGGFDFFLGGSFLTIGYAW